VNPHVPPVNFALTECRRCYEGQLVSRLRMVDVLQVSQVVAFAQIAAFAADDAGFAGTTGGGAGPVKGGAGLAGGNVVGGSPLPGNLALLSSGEPCATRHEQTKIKRAEYCGTSMI
jgi:hypothetical protein